MTNATTSRYAIASTLVEDYDDCLAAATDLATKAVTDGEPAESWEFDAAWDDNEREHVIVTTSRPLGAPFAAWE